MPIFRFRAVEARRCGSLLRVGALSLLTFGIVPARGAEIDPVERERVVDAVIQNVQRHYFNPRIAQATANELAASKKRGEYDAAASGQALADLLTKQIRAASHDMHLEVVYSESPLPQHPQEPTPQMLVNFRQMLERQNCTFETVKILARNVGYVKLNAFPDASICQGTANKIMASLNQADAIIFDLRDNEGGDGGMVSLIASYLFDHPEFLYDPRTNPTLESWTKPVSGSKLVNKPVYILTSSTTISAAEQFTYDLKMLRRATIVGEKTHGSAHAGVFYRIDDHFGMGIPRLTAINPFSTADWEGTGVEPDVKTKAADALETAQRLAQSRLRKD